MRKEPTKSNIFCLLRGLMHDFLDLCQLCMWGNEVFCHTFTIYKGAKHSKKKEQSSRTSLLLT